MVKTMVGMKAFAKALLCPRDARTFCDRFRQHDEGEDQSEGPSFFGSGGGVSDNGDVQLGDFFESVIQFTLVGETGCGVYVPCSLTEWEERSDYVESAIEECYDNESYNPLIEALGFEELESYADVHAHPGSLDKLMKIWKKYRKRFANSYQIDEGEWAKEVPVALELDIAFEELAINPRLNLGGRCDLVQKRGGMHNIIEIKATKKLSWEHIYQVNVYGMSLDGELSICHNGKTVPQPNCLDQRLAELSTDPRGHENCINCQSNGCAYRFV